MSKAINKRKVQQALNTYSAVRGDTFSNVLDFFKALDTPKSLAAYLMFKYNEHEQLLDLDVNPLDYDGYDANRFHLDYLAVSFLSKSDFLKTSYDTTEAALAKLLKTEEICRDTNARFRSCLHAEKHAKADSFMRMRLKIDQILGPFVIEEFFEQTAWGPGSTVSVSGTDVSATRKFQEETGITAELYALIGEVLPHLYPTWFGRDGEVIKNLCSQSPLSMQESNTVFTVPKNSKSDRVAAKEPGLNSWFQHGAGNMIRKRLRAVGIDLNNQGRNQKLSMQAVKLNLATVDFSSASDSIAFKVVEYLLPQRWFTVLNALRCKSGKMPDGSKLMWHKFSSMGNGFTFELEALIFYAAALVACEGVGVNTTHVSVYGDDVIIPCEAYTVFEELSRALGFSVNMSKSFSTSYFRESCGAHWFNGVDVKPIYLKEELSDAFSVFKLANSIRRLAHRRNFNIGCDRVFLPVWRSILGRLPHVLRCLKLSEGYGDGGILSNFDEASPIRLRNDHSYLGKGDNFHEGFQILHVMERGKSFAVDGQGLLLTRLTQIRGSLGTTEESYYTKNYLVSSDGPDSSEAYGPLHGSSRRIRRDNLANSSTLGGLSTQTFRNTETFRRRTRKVVSTLIVPAWYNLGAWF